MLQDIGSPAGEEVRSVCGCVELGRFAFVVEKPHNV